MNYQNLHTLIDRYEQNLDMLNDDEHSENFKWRAVQTFQNVWFSSEASNPSFSEKFRRAKKDSSVLIDNRIVCPSNGIVKLAEKAPDEVERLFEEVLFAEDNGDLDLRQNNMEFFMEKVNTLLQKYYPGSYKYQQDRHAVSCYLAMYAPEKNYIYKYSCAEVFAQYIEFGKNLGSGNTFRLAYYHELCDIIVNALREHPSLLEKHASQLDDCHYRDNSLHLLAFDVMYCANTYYFFSGLTHKTKKEAIYQSEKEENRKKEEEARQARIDALESKIRQLDDELDIYRAITLIGIQVTDKKLGVGTVTSQNINRIHVSFQDTEKDYILSKEYLWHPTFADDQQLISAMTEYAQKTKELELLHKELSAM